jgi:hypothetical protein
MKSFLMDARVEPAHDKVADNARWCYWRRRMPVLTLTPTRRPSAKKA